MIRDTYGLTLSLIDEDGNEHAGCFVHYTPGQQATYFEPAERDEVEVVRPINATFDHEYVLKEVLEAMANGDDR